MGFIFKSLRFKVASPPPPKKKSHGYESDYRGDHFIRSRAMKQGSLQNIPSKNPLIF